MILWLQGRRPGRQPVKLLKSLFNRFFGADEVALTASCAQKQFPFIAQPVQSNTCLSVSECKKNVSTADVLGSPSPVVSFHGRKLPDHLISLEGREGQKLFHDSFRDGSATNFFSLITNYASQSDVSMCGPASLAMVLNALKLDPKQTWRRPWRWWSDEMFACCAESLQVMRREGVTLELFDRIARKQSGIVVDTRPPGSLQEFREALQRSSRTPDAHVIVSFERKALGQTGIGHFSPIAAVHESLDLVLILDVARFKYPPYWVEIPRLYEAMHGIDPITGLSRGFSLISRKCEDNNG
jgi:glutathione gamma-glutamylcysteinyltransferase